MQKLTALKAAYQLNPAVLQAKAIKWLAIVGFIAILCISSFFYGSNTMDNKWEAKIEKQKTSVALARTNNAIAAGQRLGDYVKSNAEIDAMIAAAKQKVHDYYSKNPSERVVEVSLLVPVPGAKEYVYVPEGTCPNDLFNADELRLYNEGN